MRVLIGVCCTALLCMAVARATDETDQQLQNRLRAHIGFLADDLMLGRQPGSVGYNIAANYVASQFLQMGLKPAGNEGHYFQQVPLRQALLEPGSAEMVFSRGEETIPLVFVEQFYMRPTLIKQNSNPLF